MSIRQGKRKKVYKRDGKKCCCCGSEKDLTIDHIVPLSIGGHNGTTNMQTLCFECNIIKGDKIKIYVNYQRSLDYVRRFLNEKARIEKFRDIENRPPWKLRYGTNGGV